MHSLYISSKWVLWVAALASVGVIAGTIILFAVAAATYTQGMLFQFTFITF